MNDSADEDPLFDLQQDDSMQFGPSMGRSEVPKMVEQADPLFDAEPEDHESNTESADEPKEEIKKETKEELLVQPEPSNEPELVKPQEEVKQEEP